MLVVDGSGVLFVLRSPFVLLCMCLSPPLFNDFVSLYEVYTHVFIGWIKNSHWAAIMDVLMSLGRKKERFRV